MKYKKVVPATFVERENRFVARVKPKGDKGPETRVHVKNTGRCKELLVPGATVYLEDHIHSMDSRKYRYSLISVEKQTGTDECVLINMDSQAPNKVVEEALKSGKLKLSGYRDDEMVIRPETTFGSSRFDFYIEPRHEGEEATPSAFIEVKGVTLEDGGVARFPDAPTERGVKHIRELEKAMEEGHEAYIIFVIQMKGIRYFEPNDETHPEFGEALRHAGQAGVNVLAYDCKVSRDGLDIDRPVPVHL